MGLKSLFTQLQLCKSSITSIAQLISFRLRQGEIKKKGIWRKTQKLPPRVSHSWRPVRSQATFEPLHCLEMLRQRQNEHKSQKHGAYLWHPLTTLHEVFTCSFYWWQAWDRTGANADPDAVNLPTLSRQTAMAESEERMLAQSRGIDLVGKLKPWLCGLIAAVLQGETKRLWRLSPSL